MIEEYIKPELGRVSKHIEVPELIIRSVLRYGLTSELDGGILDDDTEEDGSEYEDRLQGRAR